jgi:hypothetical protein
MLIEGQTWKPIDTHVGWPALAAILMLMVIGTAIVAYLLLETDGGR